MTADESVKGQKDWMGVVGKHYVLERPMFIAKFDKSFVLADERGPNDEWFPGLTPTFKEFQEGTWERINTHRNAYIFLAVAQKGTEIEVVDVIQDYNTILKKMVYILRGKFTDESFNTKYNPLVLKSVFKTCEDLQIYGCELIK